MSRGYLLVHVHARTCPDGPRMMMSSAQRVGCANGKQCRTPTASGHAARAMFYARTPERACYLCNACALVFAHVHHLPYEISDPPTRGEG